MCWHYLEFHKYYKSYAFYFTEVNAKMQMTKVFYEMGLFQFPHGMAFWNQMPYCFWLRGNFAVPCKQQINSRLAYV